MRGLIQHQSATQAQAIPSANTRRTHIRDGMQILETDSVATLFSILFTPHNLQVGALQRILSNLVAHSKTRYYVFHALLAILSHAGMFIFIFK